MSEILKLQNIFGLFLLIYNSPKLSRSHYYAANQFLQKHQRFIKCESSIQEYVIINLNILLLFEMKSGKRHFLCFEYTKRTNRLNSDSTAALSKSEGALKGVFAQ